MSKRMASVSFGKDSLAMVLRLLEEGAELDEVVFYDTGAEFNAIYETMERFKDEHPNVKCTVLKPSEPFFFTMFAHPVKKRGTSEIHKHGYGWCGGVCRWGTSKKTQALDAYAKANGYEVYVGIASDETKRIERERASYKHLPLVDWGMTEADCLSYCYERGYTWEECGVRLYDVLDRVSCWCCRNKNMKELRGIHDMLPTYWERLVALEDLLGQMKSKPLRTIGGDSNE